MKRCNIPAAAALLGLVLWCAPSVAQAPDPEPWTQEPELLRRAGANLAKAPWVAIIEAEMTLEGEDGPTRRDEMTVWYESSSLVRLRLGRLLIEVSPGQLIAFHEWNDDAYYIAIDPRKNIAEMISSELPPLWCPWLAIALAGGDVAVSPLVGARKTEPLRWSAAGGIGSGMSSIVSFWADVEQQRYNASVSSFRKRGTLNEDVSEYRGIAAPFLGGYQIRPAEGKTGPKLAFRREVMRETIERREPQPSASDAPLVEIGRTPRDREWTYSASPEATWPAPTIDGRNRVAELARLAPPPPELSAGDQFPAVSLSYGIAGREMLRLWRPKDVFMGGRLDGNGPHPTALILPLVRVSAVDSPWLGQVAEAVEAARREMASEVQANGRPPVIAASPVVATSSIDGDLKIVGIAAKSWAASYTAHDAGQRFPSKMPGASWLPASLLLDRVAPGADAAIVVVDRSGWITGVIGPEVTGDDLVAAIAEAVRSAAR